jgi:lysophospholipase L1-like esterase
MAPHWQFSALTAGLFAGMLAPAFAQDAPYACKAPNEVIRLTQPLARAARRLADFAPLTIVAIGSSSTAGAGASSPEANYPSRLAVALQERFPGHPITVINRGVNGEEAHDMLARFAASVIDEHPDLVLWQVGTNSVLRDDPLAAINPVILEGVRQIKEIGADVVMVDPQFTPLMVAKPETETMVELISATAKEANVNLFQRFATMRYWHTHGQLPFTAFVTADDLHMNDWGYDCLAKLLGASIAEAATREVASAQATSGRHATP